MTYDPIAALRQIPGELRPMLHAGATGWWVRMLRRCLDKHGYSGAMALDGNKGLSSNFTPELDSIVRLCQSQRGLTVDGVVGPVTWSKLASEPQAEPRQLAEGEEAKRKQIREAIVKVAQHAESLQIRERGGANRGPMVELILDHADGHPGQPWCAACVHAILDLAHAICDSYPPDLPPLSCSAIHRWAKTEGRLRVGTPAPGDLYLLAGGKSKWRHVGIVEQVADDGTLTLIEGNTSADPADISQDSEGDGVYRRHRDPGRYPGVAVDVA